MPLTLSVPGFLDRLNSFNHSFPIQSLYEVYIEDGEQLFGSISNIINQYEPNGVSSTWSAIAGRLRETVVSGTGFHYLFDCSVVNLPGANINYSKSYDITNTGGFIPGVTISNTEFSNTLSLTMRETNVDAPTNFMHGWARAVGIAGLVNFDIKKNIIVVEYGRANTRKGEVSEVRCIHLIENAAPIVVSGAQRTMDNTGEVTTRDIEFTFTQYTPRNP